MELDGCVCVFLDIGLTVSKTLVLILQLANMLGVVDPRAIVKLDHFPTCEKTKTGEMISIRDSR